MNNMDRMRLTVTIGGFTYAEGNKSEIKINISD